MVAHALVPCKIFGGFSKISVKILFSQSNFIKKTILSD